MSLTPKGKVRLVCKCRHDYFDPEKVDVRSIFCAKCNYLMQELSDERVTELSDLIARVMGDSVEEQIADYESQLAQVREDHKGRKKPALYESIVGVYLGILEGLKKDLRQRKERGA